MSRRDLIIISALINAGLLIVLFATALKSDPVTEPITATSAPLPMPSLEMKAPQENERAVIASGDEVDQVLKEFAARTMPQQITSSANELPKSQEGEMATSFSPIATTGGPSEIKPSTSSFAEELAAQYPVQVTLPEPSVKKTAQQSGEYAEVRVKKGDFLDRIARRNGTTVSEIMRVNHLKSTNLKIGQILKIPGKKEAPKSRAVTSRTSQEGYYVVQNGDNPWTIARKNQLSVSELLRLNQLDEHSARRLKPGDRLRIR